MQWPWGRSKKSIPRVDPNDRIKAEVLRDQATAITLQAQARHEAVLEVTSKTNKVSKDEFTMQLEAAVKPRRKR